MNPHSTRDMEGLRRAIKHSRRVLQPFRQLSFESVLRFLGWHYGGDRKAPQKTPDNMLEQALSIYLAQLVPDAPQCWVTANPSELKPVAKKLRLGLNRRMKQMRLDRTLRAAIANTFTFMGIVKVGEQMGQEIEFDGSRYRLGAPYAREVDGDDWVHDTAARRIDQAHFYGNKYRVPYADVIENEIYDKTAREKLRPTHKTAYDQEGEERKDSLSGDDIDQDEYQKYVELWDLWIPAERILLTIPVDPNEIEAPPLLVADWCGPECGPYHFLSFIDVPNNAMPLPLFALWRDLHDSINSMLNKAIRQAERQKTIQGVQAGGEDDVNRINNTPDGRGCLLEQPGSVQEIGFGGADPRNIALYLSLRDSFSRSAGNLETLGGLGPQAETATQENLLNENASRRVRAMQERVHRFTSDIIEALALYMYNDPFLEEPISHSVGTLRIPDTLTANDCGAAWMDFNFEIDPYSMRSQTPGARLQMLMQVFQQVVTPNMEAIMRQGGFVKWQNLLQTIDELGHLNLLRDILGFSGPPAEPEIGPIGEAPSRPSVTERIHTRINRPGATRSGRDAAMIQHLLGGGVQPDEMAAIGREVG